MGRLGRCSVDRRRFLTAAYPPQSARQRATSHRAREMRTAAHVISTNRGDRQHIGDVVEPVARLGGRKCGRRENSIASGPDGVRVFGAVQNAGRDASRTPAHRGVKPGRTLLQELPSVPSPHGRRTSSGGISSSLRFVEAFHVPMLIRSRRSCKARRRARRRIVGCGTRCRSSSKSDFVAAAMRLAGGRAGLDEPPSARVRFPKPQRRRGSLTGEKPVRRP